MIRKAAGIISFMIMAVSCLDEPDCFSLNNNVIGISFKKMSDGKADTVYFNSIIADGTDSIFFTSTLLTGFTQIPFLPLNYYRDTTTFYFQGPDKIHELRLGYSAKAQFVSKACGERFVLTDLRSLYADFDSIRVVGPTPKRARATGTNLEIYRCRNTSRIKLRFLSAVTIGAVSSNGSPVLHSQDAVTSIVVPLNVDTSESKINFTFSDGSTKEIVVGYNREQKTFFETCGEQTVLSEFKILSNTFSNVKVIRNTIQDPPLNNIEITL